MSGAIPPLPHYAFMVWCSVKAQGKLIFTLVVVVVVVVIVIAPHKLNT
jgi:hypothetical protein